MKHAYPAQLASYVIGHWPGGSAPPDSGHLEALLSVAYQASLLREEERPIAFRMVLGAPEEFPVDAGPPHGLHRLVFDVPRPFHAQELRRLAFAAKYHRALIGVRLVESGGEIWGLLQSGPRWLQGALGGRAEPWTAPGTLIVRVSAPGRLAVAVGARTVAELRAGIVNAPTFDVFESRWLAERFDDVRREVHALHCEERAKLGAAWAEVDFDVVRLVSQQMIKRLIATVRSAHHGGTLIMLPTETAELGLRYIRLKYRFAEDEPRRRYRTLLLSLMRELAKSGARTWQDYVASTSAALSALDEAIFEVSHLIAGLADVDGAVVMTKRFEILGFGGEIAGDLPDVPSVKRALDAEAKERDEERADGVGTRHRSAYRLCQALNGAIAVVVSQDDNVRFVTWYEGAVTYWDHVALGSPDV